MPDKVKEKFKQAENGQAEITVPAIVFAELAYLSEKERIEINLVEVKIYLEKYHTINQWPLTISTVLQSFEIDDIPELHDRLIAGAGKELGIPILTNDPAIHTSKNTEAIWKN